MSETAEPWRPCSGTDQELFLDSVVYGYDSLKVSLSRGADSDRILHIDFGFCISVRIQPDNVYEARPWWGKLTTGSLYILSNSVHRDELLRRSSGIYDQKFTNYFVATVESCIDVLTVEEPTVEWRDA